MQNTVKGPLTPSLIPGFIFKCLILKKCVFAVWPAHKFSNSGILLVSPGKERFLLEGKSRWVVKVCTPSQLSICIFKIQMVVQDLASGDSDRCLGRTQRPGSSTGQDYTSPGRRVW